MILDLTDDNIAFRAYTQKWVKSLTEKQFRDHQWPKTDSFSPFSIISKGRMEVLEQSRIQAMTIIPNLDCINSAWEKLNQLSDEQKSNVIVRFPNFGAIDLDGLSALQNANLFIQTMKDIDNLIKWLLDNKLHDKATRAFRRQLAEFIPKKNPFTFVFKSFYKHGMDLTLRELAVFSGEGWLAENQIDTILHTIERKYHGRDAANFFVLPQFFVQTFIDAARSQSRSSLNWDPLRLKHALDLQDFVDNNPDCEARVFTVVNTGNHWAVLVFDFKQKRILFGDSMDNGNLDRGKHDYVFVGARYILEACNSRLLSPNSEDIATRDQPQHRIRVEDWTKTPLRFPVPKQHDSSSCGFAALSAIENSIHLQSELWSHGRRVFFRVKYLMYRTSTSRENAAGIHRRVMAKRLFMRTQKCITIREFDAAWRLLEQFAPRGSSLESNISRLKPRANMWAHHVVGYLFTAGSMTTQRVENAHNLLKKNLHSKSTLDDVLMMTEERRIKECINHEELLYRREPPNSRCKINSTVEDFSEIIAENNKFLGGFARFRMIDEMTDSYFYRVVEIKTTNLEVAGGIFEYQESFGDNDFSDSEKHDNDQYDNEQDNSRDEQDNWRGDSDGDNNELEGEEPIVSQGFRQLAYYDILSMLGRDNIEAIYRVEFQFTMDLDLNDRASLGYESLDEGISIIVFSFLNAGDKDL
ncbi:hypothetical protein FBU30_008474 [Linnemannia zychae]|nr:hypothetical protein FBU30_008474 [Linnemannia zychae]